LCNGNGEKATEWWKPGNSLIPTNTKATSDVGLHTVAGEMRLIPDSMQHTLDVLGRVSVIAMAP